MRISDWSSDVCSSDLATLPALLVSGGLLAALAIFTASDTRLACYFVIGALGALLLFRFAALGIIWAARRLPRPRRPGLRLAVTNLYRPGAPTASVVMSLGLGLTVLVAIALIEGNLSRQVRQSLPEIGRASCRERGCQSG